MNVDALRTLFYAEMEKKGRTKENFSSDDLFLFMKEKNISFDLTEKKPGSYENSPIHNILE